MKLLDLFCGAGGSAVGYHRAGFDYIFGVDREWQGNYPFDFIEADALEILEMLVRSGNIERFDLVHASPPCQRFSDGAIWRGSADRHADLVTPTRRLLADAGIPYVIENVPGAPLDATVRLCGTSFDLNVIRHRVFETVPSLIFSPPCQHNGTVRDGDYVTVAGHGGDGSNAYPVWAEAMQIDWMTKEELAQAVPPPYTEWLGRQLLEQLTGEREHGTARTDLAAFAALLVCVALVVAAIWVASGW